MWNWCHFEDIGGGRRGLYLIWFMTIFFASLKLCYSAIFVMISEFRFLYLQLMNLLFSFLEPNRPHSTLLAGYFSKVRLMVMEVVCDFVWHFVKIAHLVKFELPTWCIFLCHISGCCLPNDSEDCASDELCSSKCFSSIIW